MGGSHNVNLCGQDEPGSIMKVKLMTGSWQSSNCPPQSKVFNNQWDFQLTDCLCVLQVLMPMATVFCPAPVVT